jgi:hypothetical protein
MAIATKTAGAAKETVRQKRERDQEVLVWPDLVFVEFIAAVLFTVAFVILSVYANAPLLDKANSNITPNPSKAPWYLMNLQELLLHMDPGLAGVTIPTMALVVLAIIPYVDRSNDGQGTWFGTANAVRITVFSAIYSGFVIAWSILWDDGAHVRLYTQIMQMIHNDEGRQVKWIGDKDVFGWAPGQLGNFLQRIWELIFLKNRPAIAESWHWSMPVPKSLQLGGGVHDGSLDWPKDFQNIPLPLNGTWLWKWGEPSWMPGWMRHVYWYDSYLDIPQIMSAFVMPLVAIIAPAIVLLAILWKLGWLKTVRDMWLALFTGFIMVYLSLTIIGAAIRGQSQKLVPPWKVPNLEEDPSIQRQYIPPSQQFIISGDPGSGSHA